MRLGILICVLIFLTVPPIYLLDTLRDSLPRRAPDRCCGACSDSAGCSGVGVAQARSTRASSASTARWRRSRLSMVERPEIQFEPRMPPLWGVMPASEGSFIGGAGARPAGLREPGRRRQHDHGECCHSGSFEARRRETAGLGPGGPPRPSRRVLAEPSNPTRRKGVSRSRGSSDRDGNERKGDPGAWLCGSPWLNSFLAQKLTPAVGPAAGAETGPWASSPPIPVCAGPNGSAQVLLYGPKSASSIPNLSQ